jgi:hypothetical protein
MCAVFLQGPLTVFSCTINQILLTLLLSIRGGTHWLEGVKGLISDFWLPSPTSRKPPNLRREPIGKSDNSLYDKSFNWVGNLFLVIPKFGEVQN